MARPKDMRVPIYVQIRNYIFDNIKADRWKPGDQIPSETELAKQFNVSRLTVKNALSELISSHLIYRIQGKGTFISPDLKGEPTMYTGEQQPVFFKLVAFLIPEITNRYTAQLLSGIEHALAQNGYRLLFCTTQNSQEIETKTLREVIELGAEGILIYPVEGETFSHEILKLTMQNFPIVLVDRYLKGITTNYVCSDNFQGAYDATTHLLALGHTKVACIRPSLNETSTSVDDRLAGYEKALIDYNIPIDHQIRLTLVESQNEEQNYGNKLSMIRKFVQDHEDITSIFCINSDIGNMVINAFTDLDIKIPDDLSIVFFDSDSNSLRFIAPTYVNQDERKIGQEAANLLMSIIENPDQNPRQIVLPTKLIVQHSTAEPSVRGSSVALG